ncbi:MAG: hypothetical protein KF729_09440, partial [Sandaracinaceae bacterium]|nr:hypothetical protein [Sandaracinaceae bacterium]
MSDDEPELTEEEARELAAFLAGDAPGDGDARLREASVALRGATADPGPPDATRARILASLGAPAGGARRDRTPAPDATAAGPEDRLAEAVRALRDATAETPPRAETRARVLATLRGQERRRVTSMVAGVALAFVVGGSTALAATGNLGPVVELYEAARDAVFGAAPP